MPVAYTLIDDAQQALAGALARLTGRRAAVAAKEQGDRILPP